MAQDNNSNRIGTIDSTPARVSTNFTIDRQTPKTSFGDRLKAGIDTTGNLVSGGLGAIGQFIPGGSILSAAVSSVSTMGQHETPTGAPAHMTASYGASGIMPINTTVGSTAAPAAGGYSSTTGGGYYGTGTYTGNVGGVQLPAGAQGNEVSLMSANLADASRQNAQLLQVQMAVQKENQVYTAVSNLMKAKHDTVKNSIGNVR